MVNEIEEILDRPQSQRATSKPLLALMLAAATLKARVDGRQPLLTREQYWRAVGDLRCDDTKARRELGYRHADLQTMLSDTISWLRHERLLQDEASSDERNPTSNRNDRLAVPNVDVGDEPHHIECFRNDHVRVYLATIDPGASTLYHRHRVNTLYVVIAGGVNRSDEPGHQRQRAGVGASSCAIPPATRSTRYPRQSTRPLKSVPETPTLRAEQDSSSPAPQSCLSPEARALPDPMSGREPHLLSRGLSRLTRRNAQARQFRSRTPAP